MFRYNQARTAALYAGKFDMGLSDTLRPDSLSLVMSAAAELVFG